MEISIVKIIVKNKYFFLSVLFGLIVGLIDVVIDYSIFYKPDSIFDLLLFDVPPHEIFIRSIILAVFTISGIIIQKFVNARDRNLKAITDSEFKLKEQNSLLKALIEGQSNSKIFALDTQKKYLAFNLAHKEEMKKVYHIDIAVGMDMLNLINNDLAKENAANSIDKTLAGGSFAEIVKQPGLDIIYEFFWNPIYDSNKKISGLTCFVSDITNREKAKAALIESEQRFRILSQVSPVGIYMTDLKGDCIFVNDIWSKMAGLTQDEASGQGWIEGIYEEDRKVVKDSWNKMVESKGTWGLEYRFQDSDGSITWVYGLATKMDDAEGNMIGYIGVNVDITERRKAEQALRESEEKYRATANLLPQIIFESDLRGKLIYVNKMAYLSFGYSNEDFSKGINAVDTLIPEDRRRALKNILEVMGGKQIGSQEYTALRKNGSTFPIQIISSRIIRKNKPVGLRGIIIDNTQHKNSLIALEESENRYKSFINHSGEGIYRIDIVPPVSIDLETKEIVKKINQQAIIVEVNKALASMYGFEPEDMIGRPATDFAPDYGIRAELVIKQPDHQLMDVETLDIDKDGNPLHLEESYHGEVVDRHLVRIWGVQRNINQRKQAREDLIKAKLKAEESDRLKSAFLANMSHEIRTPMNGIMGFTELLKEPDLDQEEQNKYISIIESSGTRLLNIINDLIDLSKVESGQMNISMSVIDVSKQLDHLCNFFKPLVENKGMQLLFKDSLEIENIKIKTDRDKFYAIFTNLINNAAKYTNEGYIEMGYEKQDMFLKFHVKDTGIGISEESRKIIFKRFVQADVTLSKPFEGAGLGLSITKAYVELLGGKVWVESEIGKGSQFYFTIPFIPPLLSD